MQICINVYDLVGQHALNKFVIISLCLFEKVFPPNFFDLMMHLTLHLVDELDIYGPIICHWMYLSEQTLKDLKGSVRNMCKLKGTMVDDYIFEALGLCTKYMEAFTAIKRHVQDANEEEGVAREVLDGVPKT